MIIGILDHDIFHWSFTPNLEAMKMSTYYKNQRHIVKLIYKLENLNIYDKIIIRKDKIDIAFPSELFVLPNIEYGGLAFTNGNYSPMDEKIEKSKPDITLYDKYLINKKGIKPQEDLRLLKNSAYMRLSLDGHSCNNEVDMNNSLGKRIFIYDNNLQNIENSDKIISEIRNNRLIFLVHTLKLENLDQVYKWTRQEGYSKSNKMHYINFKENEFDILLEESKTFNTPIYVPLGAQFNKNTIMKDMIDYFIEWINKAIWLLTTNNRKIRFYMSPNLKENKYKFMFEALGSWSDDKWKSNSYKQFIKERYSKWDLAVIERLESIYGNDIYTIFNTNIENYISKGGVWIK